MDPTGLTIKLDLSLWIIWGGWICLIPILAKKLKEDYNSFLFWAFAWLLVGRYLFL